MLRKQERPVSGRRKLPALRLLLCVLAAGLSAVGLSFDLRAAAGGPAELLGYLLRGLNAQALLNTVLFFLLFAFYVKTACLREPVCLSAAVLAGCFTLFTLFGRAYDAQDQWGPLFESPSAAAVTALCALGLWLLFYEGLKWLLLASDGLSQKPVACAAAQTAGRRFWLPFCFILLCWLPALVLCFPGSVTYDGANQLSQYLGLTPATAHHPWPATVVMGFVSNLFGGATPAGIFAYVVVQSLACAAAYAYACVVVRRLAGRSAWIGTALFFALLPTWGSYAQMYVKDTLFAGLFSVFFSAAASFAAKRGEASKGTAVCLAVSAIGCVLFRKNGVYAVVPALLVLAVVTKHKRGRRLAGAVAVVALAGTVLLNSVLLPAIGVEAASAREAFSLPFQQTARCCIAHPEDVQPEERAAIEAVLDYETIVSSYDPSVSDNVKDTFHGDTAALRTYLGVWLRMGVRHPLTYLQAALNAYYGYFYPGYINGHYGGGYYGSAAQRFGFDLPHAFPDLTNLVRQYNVLWSRAPGPSAAITPSTYTWLLLLCTAMLLRRRRFYEVWALAALWIILLLNCLSPVNGLVRYTLPLMGAAPVLCAFTWNALRQPKGQRRRKAPRAAATHSS